MTKKQKSNLKEDASVAETESFFKTAIDMIPIENWGFDEDIQEKLKERKHKLVDEKLDRAKRRKLAKRDKQRLARCDPEQCNTVTEVWQWLAETSKDSSLPSASNNELPAGKLNARRKRKRPNSLEMSLPTSSGPLTSRDEALKRLQQKIEVMRENRGAKSAEEYRERQRLKRRMSKLKLKERRKQEKLTNVIPQNTSSPNPTKLVNGSAKKSETSNSTSNIRNQEGKLVFSKFDFALSATARAKLKQQENKETKKSRKKSGVESLKGRDHKRLIDKVESRERKVDSLKEKNPEKAEKLEQNIKWDAAFQKSKGHIVKDNPDLLKKSLKRKEHKKEHSKKKWQQRTNTVQKQQQQKQDKRNKNIQKVKSQKKEKKLQKARKKGRLV